MSRKSPDDLQALFTSESVRRWYEECRKESELEVALTEHESRAVVSVVVTILREQKRALASPSRAVVLQAA